MQVSLFSSLNKVVLRILIAGEPWESLQQLTELAACLSPHQLTLSQTALHILLFTSVIFWQYSESQTWKVIAISCHLNDLLYFVLVYLDLFLLCMPSVGFKIVFNISYHLYINSDENQEQYKVFIQWFLFRFRVITIEDNKFIENEFSARIIHIRLNIHKNYKWHQRLKFIQRVRKYISSRNSTLY